jgi:ectoine hydroxylase-related dioxygenase (phytanoyl-CoA dioxygenase family)
MTAAGANTLRADYFVSKLAEQGYCRIDGLVSASIIRTLDRAIAARFVAAPFGQGDFYGNRTKRFGRLLAREPATARLAEHPLISQIARRLLEPFCDTIQLNVMQAIEVHPGEIAQVPHRDQDMWHADKGRIEYLLNVMWPLTPFRGENGATRVWPGSHGEAALADPPSAPGLPACCDPGGAILFLGSTLHGAGANRTRSARRGIVVGYSLGWLKPYENPWLAYPPAVARRFSPSLAALAGYRQHRPNLGNFDGQCPSVLLGGDPPEYLAPIDALTAEQEAGVAEHAARERAARDSWSL